VLNNDTSQDISLNLSTKQCNFLGSSLHLVEYLSIFQLSM